MTPEAEIKFRKINEKTNVRSDGLHKGGVRKTSYFLSRKRYEILPKLLLITNRKLHMRFRLAPRSMTLDNLELDGERQLFFQILKVVYKMFGSRVEFSTELRFLR